MTTAQPRTLGILFAAIWILCPISSRAESREEARIQRVVACLRPYAYAFFGDEESLPIQERMEHYKVPAVSIAVIREGRLAWARAYGVKDTETREPVDTSTIFQAASISKSLSAAVIMKLVEQGKIALDGDVNAYLKTWQLPASEKAASTTITIARLLNHTAGTTNFNDRTGYFGYLSTDPLPTVLQILRGEPPARTQPVTVETRPGAYHYSNGGTAILQLLIMETEGQTFEEVLERMVLEPLGMRGSTFRLPLPESLRARAATAHDGGRPLAGKYYRYPELASAGLWSTPSDLALFIGEHWLALRGMSHRIMSRESAERMLAGAVDENGAAQGFFITRKGDEIYYGHRGGNYGFYSDMIINEATGDGAVVMVNGGGDGLNSNLRREILIAIATEYGWKDYAPPRLETAPLPPERARRVAGRYRLNDDNVLEIAADEGRLVARGFDAPVRDAATCYATADGELMVKAVRPLSFRLREGTTAARDTLIVLADKAKTCAPRMAASERTPFERLLAGDFEEGIAGYEALRRRAPADRLVSEPRINNLGYALLGRGKVAEAVALLELNARWHPESANTHDSLGEAYLTAGDRERAIASYERALELDPQSASAAAALKKLIGEKP